MYWLVVLFYIYYLLLKMKQIKQATLSQRQDDVKEFIEKIDNQIEVLNRLMAEHISQVDWIRDCNSRMNELELLKQKLEKKT